MNFVLAFLLAANIIVPAYNYTEEDVKILGDVAWLENGHKDNTESDNKQCLILTGVVVIINNDYRDYDEYVVCPNCGRHISTL